MKGIEQNSLPSWSICSACGVESVPIINIICEKMYVRRYQYFGGKQSQGSIQSIRFKEVNCTLNKLRVGLGEMVNFQQRIEGGKGVGHAGVIKKSFQARVITNTKI
jgi:hypothetical protein